MLKRRLEILFNFYFKIVKNYTGILNKNYKALIFIFMLCLTSFFFRVEVLDSILSDRDALCSALNCFFALGRRRGSYRAYLTLSLTTYHFPLTTTRFPLPASHLPLPAYRAVCFGEGGGGGGGFWCLNDSMTWGRGEVKVIMSD